MLRVIMMSLVIFPTDYILSTNELIY